AVSELLHPEHRMAHPAAVRAVRSPGHGPEQHVDAAPRKAAQDIGWKAVPVESAVTVHEHAAESFPDWAVDPLAVLPDQMRCSLPPSCCEKGHSAEKQNPRGGPRDHWP